MNIGSTTAETGAARFSRQVALTLAARLLIAGGSMLAGIIVARWLGAASLGILASLSVLTLVAVSFGGLGLPSAITFLVARERRNLRPAILIAAAYAVVAGGTIGLGIVIMTPVKPGLFGDIPIELVTIAALAIPFQMLTLFCLALFLGLGNIGRYNFFDLLSQAFLVINPLVALGLLGMGLYTLVMFNAAAAAALSLIVLAMLICTTKAQSERGSFRLDMSLMAEMFRYGSRFYIAMAAAVVIFRADLLIVNYFRGSAEAGVYAVSTQVGTLLMLIPNVISTVLFPRVTEARDDGEMTCRVTRHTSLIMLVVCIAAVPLAFLLPFLYGPAFASVPFQVLILLPGVYLFGIETVQVQYFSSLGLPRAIPVFWIITLCLNIALNLIFVPLHGANAAAAVSSISYTLMFILVALYFRSQTGKSFARSFLLRGREFRCLVKLAPMSERG